MPEPETTVIDSLPEEIRGTLAPEMLTDPNIIKYKTIPDLLNGHVNLAKMISAKGVIIPKEGAALEEFDRFYNSLGRPEKIEGYKFTPVEKLHEKIKITPESEGWFRGLAHKAGLTQAQADIINKEYLGNISAMLSAQDKKWNEDVAAAELKLKNEWGVDYDKKIALAKAVMAKNGGAEVIAGLGDAQKNPAVIKFLANLGSKLSEDDVTIPAGGASPANTDALSKIKAIKENLEHPYWKEKDPKHFEACEEVAKLYEEAYPTPMAA